MTWLSDLVEQHSKLESPLSFWWWAGMASISAVVKDRIYLDRGAYKLYPNIYVMFHAESGLKKGPPVNMAKQLVKYVGNTTVISGRASIQGILKKLGTAETRPGQKLDLSSSTAFICSSELSAAIVDDPVATKILTDLYDRHYNAEEWESLLKGEQFNLQNPTVTMLAATNEAMSEDFLSNHAVKGGYLARTFVIHESSRNTLNSLILPMENPPDYKTASGYLKDLAKLKGPFRPLGSLTQGDLYGYAKTSNGITGYYCEAGLRYDDWYEQFWKDVDEQQVVDGTGTINRFGDSVLKVAMLLSLAEGTDMVISTQHIEDAIAMCEKLVGNTRKATIGKQGMSKSAPLKGLIIQEIINRPDHKISRLQLHKKFWMHYSNVQEMDDMMISICETGMISIDQDHKQQLIYKMDDKQYAEMRRYLEGKLK